MSFRSHFYHAVWSRADVVVCSDCNAMTTNQPGAEAESQQPAAAALVLPLGLPKSTMNMRSTMGEGAAMPGDGAGASAVEINLPIVGNGAEALGE